MVNTEPRGAGRDFFQPSGIVFILQDVACEVKDLDLQPDLRDSCLLPLLLSAAHMVEERCVYLSVSYVSCSGLSVFFCLVPHRTLHTGHLILVSPLAQGECRGICNPTSCCWQMKGRIWTQCY